MERREFLQAGALTALGFLAGGPAEAAQARMTAAEMQQFLQRLDVVRAAMANEPIDRVLVIRRQEWMGLVRRG